MTRRRFIALVSLCVLGMLGLIVLGTGYFVTQSEYGQDQLRAAGCRPRLASSVHGKVHVGRISGSFLTGVTIDSVELRDEEDSLFAATGKIRVEYDPRDLVDRRIHLTRVDVEHPNVVLRQHGDFTWNFKRMFKRTGPDKPKGPERGFGDFVRDGLGAPARARSFASRCPGIRTTRCTARSATARSSSTSRGRITRSGARAAASRRTTAGPTRTSRSRTRGSPIRTASGGSSSSTRCTRVESVPTFRWRNVSATVRQLGESVWVKAPHWDLPASTGTRRGQDRVGQRPARSLRRPRVRRHGLAERRGVGVSDAPAHGRRVDGARHQEREEPAAPRLRDHARWTFAPSSRGSSAT